MDSAIRMFLDPPLSLPLSHTHIYCLQNVNSLQFDLEKKGIFKS